MYVLEYCFYNFYSKNIYDICDELYFFVDFKNKIENFSRNYYYNKI